MESESKNLARVERRELADPFPSIRRLFAFAEKNTNERSLDYYFGKEKDEEAPDQVPLPLEFAPLVAEYPGEYFVISFEDRREDSRNAKDTRHIEVLLSTVPWRAQSNERLREISFTEHAVSEGKGNVVFMKVAEKVNEASFVHINEAKGDEVDRPGGQTHTVFEIDAKGVKNSKEQEFSRHDDGIFNWNGAQKRVRWIRTVRIETKSDTLSTLTHRDTYLVGMKERGGSEGSLVVETEITLDNTTETRVSIGIGSAAITHGTVIYEDADEGVRILQSTFMPPHDTIKEMDILKQDPNYAFLFERPINKEKLLSTMMQKINALRNDWDKPSAVFAENALMDESRSGVILSS